MPSGTRTRMLKKLDSALLNLNRSEAALREVLEVYDAGYPSIAHPIAASLEAIEVIKPLIEEDSLSASLLVFQTYELLRVMIPDIKSKI